MLLQLDVGNTRLKWRCLTGEARAAIADGFCVRQNYVGVEALVAALFENLGARADGARVASVEVGSVAGEAFNAELTAIFRENYDLVPRFAVVSEMASGVACGYDDPQKLGVDRWLAVLAASRRYSADVVVVVDCGSAITVDILAEGRHLGGYIAPGLRLMMSALYRNTSQVKVAALSGAELVRGRDTDGAVTAGVLSMTVGLVERVCRDETKKGASLSLVVTGGDAAEVMRHLNVPCAVHECNDLVLDGLQWSEFASFS